MEKFGANLNNFQLFTDSVSVALLCRKRTGRIFTFKIRLIQIFTYFKNDARTSQLESTALHRQRATARPADSALSVFLFFYSILVCSILALPQLSSTHPQLSTLGVTQTQSQRNEKRVRRAKKKGGIWARPRWEHGNKDRCQGDSRQCRNRTNCGIECLR